MAISAPVMNALSSDRNPTLGHHFLEITQAKRIGNVPTHASQHYFQRIVQPFKHACHTWIQLLILTHAIVSIHADYQNALLRQNQIVGSGSFDDARYPARNPCSKATAWRKAPTPRTSRPRRRAEPRMDGLHKYAIARVLHIIVVCRSWPGRGTRTRVRK
jgi:hypothetical protein